MYSSAFRNFDYEAVEIASRYEYIKSQVQEKQSNLRKHDKHFRSRIMSENRM